jgi:WD40 repeat protein
VKIWDLSTGRVLDLRGHTALVHGLASSPDGRRLASSSEDRTIKLWDTATGEEVFTLRGHTSGVVPGREAGRARVDGRAKTG